MSKPTWRYLALFSLIAACWPLLTASAGAAEAGGKSSPAAKPAALKGDYAIMAKVLEMDTIQTAKLTEAVEARDKALKAWDDSDSGKKFKEFSEALKKAKADKDKEKAKSLDDQMKPLTKERSDLQEAQRANIMAVLTPEQKAKWAGHSLYTVVMRKYKRTNPADEQEKQIRQLCEAAAKGMPDVTDKKGHGEAMRKLSDEIEQKVLTAAQREELKKPPAPKAPAKQPETKPQAEKADTTKKISAAKPLIVE
jgi:Spy/CpxP family protein refolding chaperone